MKPARLPHYIQYLALRGAVATLDLLSIERAAVIPSIPFNPRSINTISGFSRVAT